MKIKLLYAAIALATIGLSLVAANLNLGIGYFTGAEEPQIVQLPEPSCPPYCRTSR